MKGFGGWYLRLGEWALNLFLLNLLWIIFSMLGLFIVGIFPATVALFAVMRKLTMESKEVPVFKLFWTTYKREFVKANIIGYAWSLIGFVLYIDLRVLNQLDSSLLNQLFTFGLYMIIAAYLVTLLYLFPIFVHFNLKKREYFKYAIILTIGRPIQSIMLIIGLTVGLFILWRVPGLIPVFGMSFISLLVMKIASISFPKLDNPTAVKIDHPV